MTPKEKAKELYDKFYPNSYIPWNGGVNEATTEDCAKDSAIIAVDEIIPCTWREVTYKKWGLSWIEPTTTTEYWEAVKIELQKL